MKVERFEISCPVRTSVEVLSVLSPEPPNLTVTSPSSNNIYQRNELSLPCEMPGEGTFLTLRGAYYKCIVRGLE